MCRLSHWVTLSHVSHVNPTKWTYISFLRYTVCLLSLIRVGYSVFCSFSILIIFKICSRWNWSKKIHTKETTFLRESDYYQALSFEWHIWYFCSFCLFTPAIHFGDRQIKCGAKLSGSTSTSCFLSEIV